MQHGWMHDCRLELCQCAYTYFSKAIKACKSSVVHGEMFSDSRLVYRAGLKVFFEEKRILRRKRTGTPDHTRDSHSATKRERDVDTAKLKAGGALTGGRLGPLQGGPRAKAKCGAGRAKRGGAGCS